MGKGGMLNQGSIYLQQCLDRLRRGDESARQELLAGACTRLTELTRTMLQDYRRLKRWEQTDDVLQNALVRLHRTLQDVTPPSLRDFYRLAALQIRRELIDLARHYFGPEGCGRHHHTNAAEDDSRLTARPAYEQSAAAEEPATLAAWAEFHRQADALPEEEREVFDLVWYQGMKHTEAAALLGVSARTVKRRWQAACLRLHEILGGALPGL
jgi:RNA polymerase sigma-70 factor (ECF subfamily)